MSDMSDPKCGASRTLLRPSKRKLDASLDTPPSTPSVRKPPIGCKYTPLKERLMIKLPKDAVETCKGYIINKLYFLESPDNINKFASEFLQSILPELEFEKLNQYISNIRKIIDEMQTDFVVNYTNVEGDVVEFEVLVESSEKDLKHSVQDEVVAGESNSSNEAENNHLNSKGNVASRTLLRSTITGIPVPNLPTCRNLEKFLDAPPPTPTEQKLSVSYEYTALEELFMVQVPKDAVETCKGYIIDKLYFYKSPDSITKFTSEFLQRKLPEWEFEKLNQYTSKIRKIIEKMQTDFVVNYINLEGGDFVVFEVLVESSEKDLKHLVQDEVVAGKSNSSNEAENNHLNSRGNVASRTLLRPTKRNLDASVDTLPSTPSVQEPPIGCKYTPLKERLMIKLPKDAVETCKGYIINKLYFYESPDNINKFASEFLQSILSELEFEKLNQYISNIRKIIDEMQADFLINYTNVEGGDLVVFEVLVESSEKVPKHLVQDEVVAGKSNSSNETENNHLNSKGNVASRTLLRPTKRNLDASLDTPPSTPSVQEPPIGCKYTPLKERLMIKLPKDAFETCKSYIINKLYFLESPHYINKFSSDIVQNILPELEFEKLNQYISNIRMIIDEMETDFLVNYTNVEGDLVVFEVLVESSQKDPKHSVQDEMVAGKSNGSNEAENNHLNSKGNVASRTLLRSAITGIPVPNLSTCRNLEKFLDAPPPTPTEQKPSISYEYTPLEELFMIKLPKDAVETCKGYIIDKLYFYESPDKINKFASEFLQSILPEWEFEKLNQYILKIRKIIEEIQTDFVVTYLNVEGGDFVVFIVHIESSKKYPKHSVQDEMVAVKSNSSNEAENNHLNSKGNVASRTLLRSAITGIPVPNLPTKRNLDALLDTPPSTPSVQEPPIGCKYTPLKERLMIKLPKDAVETCKDYIINKLYFLESPHYINKISNEIVQNILPELEFEKLNQYISNIRKIIDEMKTDFLINYTNVEGRDLVVFEVLVESFEKDPKHSVQDEVVAVKSNSSNEAENNHLNSKGNVASRTLLRPTKRKLDASVDTPLSTTSVQEPPIGCKYTPLKERLMIKLPKDAVETCKGYIINKLYFLESPHYINKFSSEIVQNILPELEFEKLNQYISNIRKIIDGMGTDFLINYTNVEGGDLVVFEVLVESSENDPKHSVQDEVVTEKSNSSNEAENNHLNSKGNVASRTLLRPTKRNLDASVDTLPSTPSVQEPPIGCKYTPLKERLMIKLPKDVVETCKGYIINKLYFYESPDINKFASEFLQSILPELEFEKLNQYISNIRKIIDEMQTDFLINYTNVEGGDLVVFEVLVESSEKDPKHSVQDEVVAGKSNSSNEAENNHLNSRGNVASRTLLRPSKRKLDASLDTPPSTPSVRKPPIGCKYTPLKERLMIKLPKDVVETCKGYIINKLYFYESPDINKFASEFLQSILPELEFEKLNQYISNIRKIIDEMQTDFLINYTNVEGGDLVVFEVLVESSEKDPKHSVQDEVVAGKSNSSNEAENNHLNSKGNVASRTLLRPSKRKLDASLDTPPSTPSVRKPHIGCKYTPLKERLMIKLPKDAVETCKGYIINKLYFLESPDNINKFASEFLQSILPELEFEKLNQYISNIRKIIDEKQTNFDVNYTNVEGGDVVEFEVLVESSEKNPKHSVQDEVVAGKSNKSNEAENKHLESGDDDMHEVVAVIDEFVNSENLDLCIIM